MARRLLTEDDARQVAALHAQGFSRNAIAERTGLSPASVSKLAHGAGLEFDRTRVAAATAAKTVDNRARRAELETGLLDDAARLRAQLFAPMTAFAFGGKDNDYNEHEIPQPDARSQKDIMAAVGTAITASAKLAELNTAVGEETGRSMLGALAEGLQRAYAALPAEPAGP